MFFIKKGVLMKRHAYLLHIGIYAFIGFTLPAAAAMAAPTSDSGKVSALNDTGKVVLTGWGSYETGQLFNINYTNLSASTIIGSSIPRQWLMREQVNLTGKYQCNEYFCAKVGITARMWYDEYPVENRQQNGNDPLVSYFTVYPSDAQAIFSYNKFNNIGLGLQVGYFPMTYDSCCRNLGEYLFRSNSYPPYSRHHPGPDVLPAGRHSCERNLLEHGPFACIINARGRLTCLFRSVA